MITNQRKVWQSLLISATILSGIVLMSDSAKAEMTANTEATTQATQQLSGEQDNRVALKQPATNTQQPAGLATDGQTSQSGASVSSNAISKGTSTTSATDANQTATSQDTQDPVDKSDTAVLSGSMEKTQNGWSSELPQATKIEAELRDIAPTAPSSLPISDVNGFHQQDQTAAGKLLDDYINSQLKPGQSEAEYLLQLDKAPTAQANQAMYNYLIAQFDNNPVVVAAVKDLADLQKTEMTPVVDKQNNLVWVPILVTGDTAEDWMNGVAATAGPDAMAQLMPWFVSSTPTSYMFLNNLLAARPSGDDSATAGFPGHASIPPENSEIDSAVLQNKLPLRIYVPTKPTQPTQPAEPNLPNQPTQPTAPRQPSQPTEPTQPSQPNQPTQPNQPSQPTQPTQPNQSSEPGKPVPPAEPSTPGVPSRTLVPGTPTYHQVVTKRTTTTSQKVVAQKLPQTSENERQNSGTVLAGLAGLMAMLGMAWKKRKS